MTLRSQKKHRQQRMPLRSFPLQKRTLKKASITNPKCLPVGATTTAMGTRWVMLKNLGTVQEVSGSADPVHEPLPAALVRRGTQHLFHRSGRRWPEVALRAALLCEQHFTAASTAQRAR